ncbi:hypothetical protein ACFXDO_08930 [Streptomyces nigra]|uniref:hypothetical protein n=1 Tax=Streptomyces nigra TaxID=1827580 RepID=UPI0036905C01
MNQILVEEDFAHIEGRDMNIILNLLDELGLEAEPTPPRGRGDRHRWQLALHWQPSDLIPHEIALQLPSVTWRIREHFVGTEKQPPSTVAVYARDETVLWSSRPEAA